MSHILDAKEVYKMDRDGTYAYFMGSLAACVASPLSTDAEKIATITEFINDFNTLYPSKVITETMAELNRAEQEPGGETI